MVHIIGSTDKVGTELMMYYEFFTHVIITITITLIKFKESGLKIFHASRNIIQQEIHITSASLTQILVRVGCTLPHRQNTSQQQQPSSLPFVWPPSLCGGLLTLHLWLALNNMSCYFTTASLTCIEQHELLFHQTISSTFPPIHRQCPKLYSFSFSSTN